MSKHFSKVVLLATLSCSGLASAAEVQPEQKPVEVVVSDVNAENKNENNKKDVVNVNVNVNNNQENQSSSAEPNA